jgi:hypothetical protein
MPKTTVEIIDDSIIQVQELADLYKKDLKDKYDLTGFAFSILFNCKEGNLDKLQERKQYLLEVIPHFKPGKKAWKVFTEALEGLNNLEEISQDPIKKHILKRPLEEAVEESRQQVIKLQKIMKSEDSQLEDDLSTEENKDKGHGSR